MKKLKSAWFMVMSVASSPLAPPKVKYGRLEQGRRTKGFVRRRRSGGGGGDIAGRELGEERDLKGGAGEHQLALFQHQYWTDYSLKSPPSYSDVHIYLWDYPLNSQHDFTQPPRERRRQQFKQINWEKMSKVNYFYSSTSVKKSPAILLIPWRVIIKQDPKQKLSK